MRSVFLVVVLLVSVGCGAPRRSDGPSGPSCSDGEKNGEETDVDCGGRCRPCANGLACVANEGCAGGNCADGKCAAPADCVAEDDQAFCRRQSKTCGTLASPDNCGTARTVDCGECVAPLVCTGITMPVSGSRTLGSLSSTEQGRLCDFLACGRGGYGVKKDCGDGLTVSGAESRAECLKDLGRCPSLAVQDVAACEAKLSADLCQSIQVALTAPECAALRTCGN